MTEPTQDTHQTTREQQRIALRTIEDKGAAIGCWTCVEIFITDYLILASAGSNPHLKAMKTSLDEALKAAGVQLIGANREVDSGWLVVDAFDFVVPANRRAACKYQLDQLWGDAEEYTSLEH